MSYDQSNHSILSGSCLLLIGDPLTKRNTIVSTTIDNVSGYSEAETELTVSDSTVFNHVNYSTLTFEVLLNTRTHEIMICYDVATGNKIKVVRAVAKERLYRIGNEATFGVHINDDDVIRSLGHGKFPNTVLELTDAQVLNENYDKFKTKDNRGYYDTIVSKPPESTIKVTLAHEWNPEALKLIFSDETVVSNTDNELMRIGTDISAGKILNAKQIVLLPKSKLFNNVSINSKNVQDHTLSIWAPYAQANPNKEVNYSLENQTDLTVEFDINIDPVLQLPYLQNLFSKLHVICPEKVA